MGTFKVSKYVRPYREEGHLFLFNTLNGALLFFEDNDTIQDVEDLLSRGTIVESDREWIDALKQYRFLLDESINEVDLAKFNFFQYYQNKQMLSFTIYVTNSCNFRCVYCPQDHEPAMMEKHTMEGIVSAIDNILENGDYEFLNISWFGGEPLLNLDVIRFGMNKVLKICQKRKTKILSGMTTNAYLLTSTVFRELLDLRVTDYQITLDGTQNAHDKNRMLSNGDGTWEVIWNNLLSIKNIPGDFEIALRMNTNMDNMEDVIELLDLVRSHFDSRFKVRIQPIVNMGGETGYSGFCSAVEFQLIQINLYDYMRQKEYPTDILEYYISPFSIMCNCCNPNYYVIREDGAVCKCELKIKSPENLIGNVEDGHLSVSQDLLASFVVPNFSDQCTACDLFPLCYGLHCPIKSKQGASCEVRDIYLLDDYIMVAAKYLLQRAKK